MTGVIGYQNLPHLGKKRSILVQFPRIWGFWVPEKRPQKKPKINENWDNFFSI